MTAEQIKQFMKERRIYQWEVAEKIGINEFTFARWLRSELKPEHEKKIIEAINCLLGQEGLIYKDTHLDSEAHLDKEPIKEAKHEQVDLFALFEDVLKH